MNLACHWRLDPSVVYLNHGSFGACPSAVLDAQAALRLEMEREPVDFLVCEAAGATRCRPRDARGAFWAPRPGPGVRANATAGVNAVLRSLALRAGR